MKVLRALLPIVLAAVPASSIDAAAAMPQRLELAHRTVPDSVDHAPVRPDGTHEPSRSRPRFSETRAGAGWTWRDSIDLDVAVTSSDVTFLRDAYGIEGLSLTLDRTFDLDAPGASWRMRFSLSGHSASEARKTSRTRLGDVRLTDVTADGAGDATMGVGFSRSFAASPSITWTVGTDLLVTLVESGALSGTATDEQGCRFRFDAAHRGGRVDLVEPCGDVESFGQRYPNQQSIDDRFGFSPLHDMSYTQRSVLLHVSARKRIGRAFAAFGLDAGRHSRGAFDTRTRSLGERPATYSAVLFARADVPVGRRWSVQAGAALHRAPFLVDLPLGYNNLTARRYERFATSLSVGVRYRFGEGPRR